MSKILESRVGPVTTITINRPEVRNALDRQAAAELAAACRRFEADPESRVAVLTGAEGSFCAGADLKEMAKRVDYEAWAGSENGPTHPLLAKPVIAAVAGHACAGGLGLALWCDLRVADETAIFGVFSRRWGVPMSDGTTVRLPRLIGMGRALDMLLTGRSVDAQEAKEIGLVNYLTPVGQAVAVAQALAAKLAAFPQIAMNSDRRSAYLQQGLPIGEAIAEEMACAKEARATEAQSGAARFQAGAGRHGRFDDS